MVTIRRQKMAEYKKFKDMSLIELVKERQKKIELLNMIDFYINKKDPNYRPTDYRVENEGEQK